MLIWLVGKHKQVYVLTVGLVKFSISVHDKKHYTGITREY